MANAGLLLIRLGLASVFLFHGVTKLMNLSMTVGFFGSLGLSPFVAYLVAGIEALGGLALLLGLYTRWIGVALAVIMAGAIATVKASKGFAGFEFELLLLLSLVGVALTGPGSYSLPGMMKKKSNK